MSADNGWKAMTKNNVNISYKYEIAQVMAEFTQQTWVKGQILLLLPMVMLLSVTLMVEVSCLMTVRHCNRFYSFRSRTQSDM